MSAWDLASGGSFGALQTTRRPHPSQRRTASAGPRLAWGHAAAARDRPDVSDLCLGGNVFGWTADEPTSFALLDRYVDATPSTVRPFVDTAESYGDGTSERILGAWMASRGIRDRVVVATKASPHGRRSTRWRRARSAAAAERSLRNLQTDRIDLYYAHYDDETTPLEETLTAFDELVQAGKVRYVAASNYSAERLTEALETSDAARASPVRRRCRRTTT